MKKIKGHFCSPSHPTPSHPTPYDPTPSNSGKALVLRIEHWTPKGDCKVTGKKERTSILYRKSL